LGKINMGNLRQSMTDEEWAEMQPSRTKTLLDIIEPLEGEPNILNDIVDRINHPKHYGGASNQYEVIKVIDAWGLDFALGNVVKYVARAGKKSDLPLEDLEKAKWYICHAIEKLKGGK
jgi:hypothetical protein